MLATKKKRPIPSASILTETVDDDLESQIANASTMSDGNREKWQQIIDHDLIEFGRNSHESDDEYPVTSNDVVSLAIEIARILGQTGQSAPTRVVSDAHGNIVFEKVNRQHLETVRISENKAVHCVFENSELKQRHEWI